MSGAQGALLPDGRLHLHHGPIDLIVEAEGPGRAGALRRAGLRFRTVLDELVAELPLLRRPLAAWPEGAVARRMAAAVAPWDGVFVTPMAAVAGAVADEVLEAMWQEPGLSKAHVNNGGDIAFRLKGGAEVVAATGCGLPGRIRVGAGEPVGGMATSGWRGRSHSLGIADAVTVLAATAAAADVAATLIANAVDLPDHGAVSRAPARALAPDSDLGDRPVTTAVGPLAPSEIARALDAGSAAAEAARARGLIHAALLVLAGAHRVAGALPDALPDATLALTEKENA